MLTCKHKGGSLKCDELGMQDLPGMNRKFYSNPNKQVRNYFILKHVTIETPNRHRPRNTHNQRQITVKCFLNKQRNGVVSRAQFCKLTFTETLGDSTDKVNNLCKVFFENDCTPEEKRGGDTRSSYCVDKRAAVKACIESRRSYLASDLSRAKLREIYKKVAQNIQVNYEFFRNYEFFDNEYNIGFGSPASDVCSLSLLHKENLKLNPEGEIKSRLETVLSVDKLKAKSFYTNLQTVVQGAKVYYNLEVCESLATDRQSTYSTFCYIWLQNEYAKGSCQISSAVYHRLCNSDLTVIHALGLVTDGCGGQNKNRMMVGMACTWLQNDALPSVQSVFLQFPIVGHSYIPHRTEFSDELRRK
ncbi:hypothetical protein PR048_031717 [Dryococelus australis]|uniref:Uncharacterized protein n=1 Tax=Dryococelus australis TaxID=614101 RepID=A0ABQ9G620_9NEOP|nr:hypothetical protein PR048_031717 [Dryococelus australis]